MTTDNPNKQDNEKEDKDILDNTSNQNIKSTNSVFNRNTINENNVYSNNTESENTVYNEDTKFHAPSISQKNEIFANLVPGSVLKSQKYSKFLEAFDLDPTDVDLPFKVKKTIEDIQKESSSKNLNDLRFSILYILREIPFYSFEMFINFLSGHQRNEIAEVLKELSENYLIIKENPANPAIRKFNEYLYFASIGKKKSFYFLNRENPRIEEHINKIDEYVSPYFKQRVEEEKKYYDWMKKDYEKNRRIQKRKLRLRNQRNKDKYVLICEALVLYAGTEQNKVTLANYITAKCCLTTRKKWRTQYIPLLFEKGILEDGSDDAKMYVKITDKCRDVIDEWREKFSLLDEEDDELV